MRSQLLSSQSEEVGGLAQLLKIQLDTSTIGNAASYAKIVRENAILRRSIRVANDVAERECELPSDVEDFVDWAEGKVFDLRGDRQSGTVLSIGIPLDKVLANFDAMAASPGIVTGTPTGFTDLDKILSGLHASNLVIVGSRPGMGTTAFALGLAANVSMKQNLPVLCFRRK